MDNEFDWFDVSEPKSIEDIFEKGVKYHIKDGNIWNVYTYIGFDPEHSIGGFGDDEIVKYPVLIFKAKNGTSYKSVSYIEDLLKKNLIKVYDSDFNFFKTLRITKVSVNTEGFPNIKPNFVIIFKNGINIQDTYDLQEILLEMGYTWYNKGKRLITPNDVNGKLLTIESVNWDTSNRLYSGMDSTFGDRKILMLSSLDSFETESDKESRLNFIHDHPKVQVIDGDDLLSKI